MSVTFLLMVNQRCARFWWRLFTAAMPEADGDFRQLAEEFEFAVRRKITLGLLVAPGMIIEVWVGIFSWCFALSDDRSEWLTTGEAADRLNVGRERIRQICRAGSVASYRTPGNRLRISRRDIEGRRR